MAVCINPDCNIAETGKCIEGFELLDKCPTYGKEKSDDFIDASDVSSINKSSTIEEVDKLNIHSGDVLDRDEVNSILKKNGGRIISCVGPSNIGKTTLLASFYELFNKNISDEFSFSESKSLLAFEEICHFSRALSQNKVPFTPRTLRKDDVSFYHLSLNRRADNRRVNLILCDRAGEEYESAKDSSEECKKLYEISRSDILLLLVDGESLGDTKKRHLAKNNVISMLQAFKEDQVLSKNTKIIIVMTKLDLPKKNGTLETARIELNKLLEKSLNILGDSYLEITSHEVSARPEDTKLDSEHGIKELIRIFFEYSHPKIKYQLSIDYNENIPRRSFLNLRGVQ
ncbi:hypothetical protein TW85_14365 [Marinomonas sp. S3726]|uniref:TRAFAC clade GTPase domain-containing protein n=1 Tax=Marinomonas sp. S3726 TaxID=579484 RepID=UPI0005F9CFB1|nr:GTPase [Marinomonas sp. S3726]KJZ12801.1 hypothetical protein TW85_14365 [Marinomonas sp. S3726]